MSEPAEHARSVRDRTTAVVGRVTEARPVRAVLAPQRIFGDADGNLLAAGLAYGALFAVISGLLLLVSVLVVIGDTPAARDEAIDAIVAAVPPLESFAHAIVDGLADGARVGTLLGLAAFAWGASGFYLSLHAALDRVMPGDRRRSSIVARIHGLLAVSLVVGAILAAIVAGSVLSFDRVFTTLDALGLAALVGPIVGVGASTLVALLAFRFVPTDPPTVRESLPGAFAAGVGIGLLTALFGILAPYLVGELAGLGVIASVFVALIWFSWTFRILLYGASIAAARRALRAEVPAAGTPGEGSGDTP